jgi:hypothetical protein
MRRREAAFSQWFLAEQPRAAGGPAGAPGAQLRGAPAPAVQHRQPRLGEPQTSLLTPGQVGYDPTIAPYPYDPDYARILLREAGYADGFTLRGLVSESSSSVYQLLRGFLAKVGVKLEANIVPRSEWLNQVVNARIRGDASLRRGLRAGQHRQLHAARAVSPLHLPVQPGALLADAEPGVRPSLPRDGDQDRSGGDARRRCSSSTATPARRRCCCSRSGSRCTAGCAAASTSRSGSAGTSTSTTCGTSASTTRWSRARRRRTRPRLGPRTPRCRAC